MNNAPIDAPAGYTEVPWGSEGTHAACMLTTRVLRRMNRQADEMLRHMAAAQKRWWN